MASTYITKLTERGSVVPETQGQARSPEAQETVSLGSWGRGLSRARHLSSPHGLRGRGCSTEHSGGRQGCAGRSPAVQAGSRCPPCTLMAPSQSQAAVTRDGGQRTTAVAQVCPGGRQHPGRRGGLCVHTCVCASLRVHVARVWGSRTSCGPCL